MDDALALGRRHWEGLEPLVVALPVPCVLYEPTLLESAAADRYLEAFAPASGGAIPWTKNARGANRLTATVRTPSLVSSRVNCVPEHVSA